VNTPHYQKGRYISTNEAVWRILDFSAPPAAETTSESPAPSPAASTAASESDNESQGQGDNAVREQAEQARKGDPENEASQPSSSGSSSVAS